MVKKIWLEITLIIFGIIIMGITFSLMFPTSIISNKDIIYFDNSPNQSFYLDYSLIENELYVYNVSIKFVPKEYTSIVYTVELTPTYYSYSTGTCLATNTKITGTNCCKAMGYIGKLPPPGNGYDYCFNYQTIIPNLKNFTLGGQDVLLTKDFGGNWKTSDLSNIINSYCISNIENDEPECDIPATISNDLANHASVEILVENVNFININITENCTNCSEPLPIIKETFWEKIWKKIIYIFTFKWL